MTQCFNIKLTNKWLGYYRHIDVECELNWLFLLPGNNASIEGNKVEIARKQN